MFFATTRLANVTFSTTTKKYATVICFHYKETFNSIVFSCKETCINNKRIHIEVISFLEVDHTRNIETEE